MAAGFGHDQMLQGGHVGAGAAAHRGGQAMRCHMNAAAVWMHGCIGNGPETQVARASVWHWPREAAQTVAAGFDHDLTLQGGHVGS